MVILAAVGLGILGCQDTRDTAPTGPELQLTGPACRYSDVKKYARNLFGNPSAGSDLAQAMSNFAANSPAATNLGFDIFAAVAALRDATTDGFTDDQITNAANLTLQVVRCSDVNVTGTNSVAVYSQALAKAGGYEVRGGSSSASPSVADPNTAVLAYDKQAGIQAPGDDFAGWLGGRVLFYGYPVGQFSGEQTGAAAGLSGRVTFDWSLVASTAVTLPRPTRGRFSLCVSVDDELESQLRVQKTTHILEIANPVAGLACVLTQVEPSGLAPRLAALGARLFAPTPLYAGTRKTSTPTGSAGSFSPFQVGNPLDVTLSFKSQPKDAKVNAGIAGSPGPNIAVLAVGDAGTEWEGVLIQLLAFNNNGTTVSTTNDLATTNAAGIAEFPGFTITKTGGYKLRAVTVSADPDVQGFVPSFVESKRFNVRP
jgi:hypothetical protein